MRAIAILLTAGLATTALCAGGVSGKWTAEVQERHGDSVALVMDLKEDDSLLTGTVRGSRGEYAISSGTIDGDEISFSVVTEFDGYQLRQHYRGTLEGDIIHFTLTVEDGHSRAIPIREFQAERVK